MKQDTAHISAAHIAKDHSGHARPQNSQKKIFFNYKQLIRVLT